MIFIINKNKEQRRAKKEEIWEMALTVVKGALKSIREKGFGAFLRELKEEGYLYSPTLSIYLFIFLISKTINPNKTLTCF
jgi:hypothetical protein